MNKDPKFSPYSILALTLAIGGLALIAMSMLDQGNRVYLPIALLLIVLANCVNVIAMGQRKSSTKIHIHRKK